jgi:hypothetical protein
MFVKWINAGTATMPNTDGDYRLQVASPAIDRGDNGYFASGLNPDLSHITTDPDGSPRFHGGTVDMGAYEAIYFDITVAANPTTGGVVAGGGRYLQGETVTITASPASTYLFTNWTNAVGDAVSAVAVFTFTADAVYTFSADAKVDLTAHFTPASIRKFTVAYDANGGLNAPVDSLSPYLPGSYVTVIDTGYMSYTYYVFTRWNTKPGGYGDDYYPGDAFVITGDVTLYAQWIEASYTDPLIQRLITIDPSAHGLVTSDKRYAKTRDTVTLTIRPDAGYIPDLITVHYFHNPSVTVRLRGEGDVRTFLMPPDEVVVTATFKPFTETGNTATATVESLTVSVIDGLLHVGGLTAGEPWRVYTLRGALVYHGLATGATATIPLPARGLYIVTGNNETAKVVY